MAPDPDAPLDPSEPGEDLDGGDEQDDGSEPITASGVRVGRSPIHGFGMFATRDLAPGEVLERSPVLVIDEDDEALVAETVLDGYCYTWDDGALGLGLGYTSLYNHSSNPNARYWTMPEHGMIEVVVHRPIRAGEEVLVTYNGDPEAEGDLWFDEQAAPQEP